MKYFDWNIEKNTKLKIEREISFEQIIVAIEEGYLLDNIKHKNVKKYHQQKMFIILLNDYVYLVPYVEDEEKIFLKTIIPSRKATKEYLLKKRRN